MTERNSELNQNLDDSNPIHQTLLQTCKESITDIFRSFVFTDVNIEAIPTQEQKVSHEHNSYFFMNANKLNAVMCISMNQASMLASVRKILGDEKATEKDAIDAAQELANIIYGGIKKRMQLSGYTFGLATYQYTKLISGSALIQESPRYGYDFILHSDLGPITIKVLYDSIELVTAGKPPVKSPVKESTVNSSYIPGYIPVKFVDLTEEKKITFDLYLHLRLNNKIILYKRGGDKVDKNILTRFQKFHIEHFYIKEADQGQFIDYVSAKTSHLIKDESLLAPEKKDQLDKSAQQIISGFFNDPDNQDKYLENAQKIIENVIDELLEENDPHKKLMQKLRENLKQTEMHAVNVQTFATTMALSLGYTSQKVLVSIAMGALFHDIGYSKIPAHLHHKLGSEVSKNDFEIIKRHPDLGAEILANSSSEFPFETKLIVQQHHEHHNGTGYPRGIKGFQTYEPSKIVAIANDFDGRMRALKSPKDPKEVILEMWNQISVKDQAIHDPVLFKKIFSKMTPDLFG